ncbi:MAG: NUDIX domain-containing protein [Thomasclavelia sp.]|nr:NUDIX domain-containing protein [Thomasclavelia sp.]
MKNIKFHITVKGIVVNSKKVLILKRVRPSTDGLGYWELPGGGLQYKETPDEALHREIREETGLEVDILHLGYTFTKIRDDYQTIGIGYLCKTSSTNVQISNEHTEYKFVDIVDLNNYLHDDILKDVNSLLSKYSDEL